MFDGKICLVTGGTRGIGKAIAQLFSKNGATVYVVGRNAENVFWVHEWNKGVIGKIKFLNFDITNEKAAINALGQIRKECKRLDILINNAAVEYNENIGMISSLHMMEMLEINIAGTINMLQIISRLMSRQGTGGNIINIASVVGIQGNPGQLVYSATKGAVIAITKTAAKELAFKNIRVNAVAPGLTRTEMIKNTDEKFLKNRIDKIALKRMAEPEEIAQACFFLASDNAAYITGHVLSVVGCTSL